MEVHLRLHQLFLLALPFVHPVFFQVRGVVKVWLAFRHVKIAREVRCALLLELLDARVVARALELSLHRLEL